MDEKRYYEFIKRIPKSPHVNSVGYITSDGIPFYDAGNAVKYIMRDYPEAKPGDEILVYDPEKCKKAALRILPEYEKLMNDLEIEMEQKRVEIDSMVSQINKLSDKDLIESVQKQVLKDELHRKVGEHSGLIQGIQKIRNRKQELINCVFIK